MAAFFISHSSEDQAAVERLRDRLREWGYGSMFLDFDPDDGIAVGREWEQELYAQLHAADAVVFVGSRASVSSRWCFAELALARSARKPIFPVAIEAGVRMRLLDDRQWLELGDGDGADGRLERALRARFDPRDALSWDASRPPYPGLFAFEAGDAGVFFGRDEKVGEVLAHLDATLGARAVRGGDRRVGEWQELARAGRRAAAADATRRPVGGGGAADAGRAAGGRAGPGAGDGVRGGPRVAGAADRARGPGGDAARSRGRRRRRPALGAGGGRPGGGARRAVRRRRARPLPRAAAGRPRLRRAGVGAGDAALRVPQRVAARSWARRAHPGHRARRSARSGATAAGDPRAGAPGAPRVLPRAGRAHGGRHPRRRRTAAARVHAARAV